MHLSRFQLPREGNVINWLRRWGIYLHFNSCLQVLTEKHIETPHNSYSKAHPHTRKTPHPCPLPFGALPCHRGDRYASVMAAWRAVRLNDSSGTGAEWWSTVASLINFQSSLQYSHSPPPHLPAILPASPLTQPTISTSTSASTPLP